MFLQLSGNTVFKRFYMLGERVKYRKEEYKLELDFYDKISHKFIRYTLSQF